MQEHVGKNVYIHTGTHVHTRESKLSSPHPSGPRDIFACPKAHVLGLCFFFGIKRRNAGLHTILAFGLEPEVLRAVGFLFRKSIPGLREGLSEWGPLFTQHSLKPHSESRARRARTGALTGPLVFLLLPLPPGGRSLRRAYEGHHAADLQKEALLVAGGLLQPAEERPGEEV